MRPWVLEIRNLPSHFFRANALEEKGIYISAGSACAARKPQPSATLKAVGTDRSLLA